MIFPPVFPPFFLYAETHYRFPFFISYLSKSEPELIADAPHRLEPGRRLPILLLAKDAHRYPSELLSVAAVVSSPEIPSRTIPLISQRVRITDPLWWTVCDIDVEGARGWITVDVQFQLQRNGRAVTYTNDNHRTSGRAPLRVYVSPDPLPRLPGLLLGEPHAHSSYTHDQVEFGVPPGAGRAMAKSMGLQFWCVTDHSYDLDDRPESYLHNHPDIPKWHSLQAEIDALNSMSDGFALIRGEEVSARNCVEKNVHCLVFGDRTYHPGAGDSAERWFHTRSDLSITELLSRLSSGAAAFGAHVKEPVPFLQRLLLGRDVWHDEDIDQKNLAGIQFWNGSRDGGWEDGKNAWIAQLLRGRKFPAIAGNDAHGNFNRFRQIGIPFFRIAENDRQLFGRVRTGVYSRNTTETGILNALVQGHSIMTDGPVADISGLDGESLLGKIVNTGSRIRITSVSSAEFGPIRTVRLFKGVRGKQSETIAAEWSPTSTFHFSEELELHCTEPGYVRVEVETNRGELDEKSHLCLTNPVWCSSNGKL